MQRSLLLGAASAALSLPCLAQSEFIGFTYNSAVGATSRGTLVGAAGEVMVRIDGSEYAGWGTANPGFRTIDSIFLVIQDQNVATQETFDIKVYPEDPANPGFPLLTAGITVATGVAGPPGTTGTVAAARTVTPASPVLVPIQGGGDIFVAFALPANASWSTDGLSVHSVLGYQPSPTFLVYDIPGSPQQPLTPPVPANSHGLRYGPTLATPLLYDQRRMYYVDVAHRGAGGTVMGITNQTSYVASNNPPPAGWGPAPGTADFLSGVNPDVTGFTPGRVDDINFDFYQTGLANGALVVFLMDLAPAFGPEVPISTFAPGTGVICLNPASVSTLGIGFINASEAWLVTTIPPAVRPTLGGLPVRQQAVAIDPATGNLIASPCGGQRF